jgi:hypothetical protein
VSLASRWSSCREVLGTRASAKWLTLEREFR